jgi:hypothetical protein
MDLVQDRLGLRQVQGLLDLALHLDGRLNRRRRPT